MSDTLALLRDLAAAEPLAAGILFILLRAVAIVVPLVQGAPIDLAGAAVFGFWRGFLYAESGIMIGAITAFYFGRWASASVTRIPLLTTPLVTRWVARLSHATTWQLIVLRLLTNPLFDYISYAAGLARVPTSRYLVSTVVGNVPSMLVVFLLGAEAAKVSDVLTLCLIALAVCAGIGYHVYTRGTNRISGS
jgi:uncharacterized membrane protein YdjX (TVP38/TMEM64 family)